MLQRAMQGFTEKIVGLMKNENLFESQGGPIILSQVQVLGLCLFHLGLQIYATLLFLGFVLKKLSICELCASFNNCSRER